jgi:hypothetical protein
MYLRSGLIAIRRALNNYPNARPGISVALQEVDGDAASPDKQVKNR